MTFEDLDFDALERRAEHNEKNRLDLLMGLVRLRRANGLSQADIAERMGISQPAVAKLERYDANPTLSTLSRYADAAEIRIHSRLESDAEVQRALRRTAVIDFPMPYAASQISGLTANLAGAMTIRTEGKMA